MSGPKTYVLVLNWNGWADTIECLESLFRSDYTAYQVVVCDNGSEDGSLERIGAWASGRLDVWTDPGNPLRPLTHPPVGKPIRYVEYSRAQAESGGDARACEAPLVLIQTGRNLGFSGGNNVGLRFVLARGDGEYVWLLNNDTVVQPEALSRMVCRLSGSVGAGMCGATLVYYSAPEAIQTLGGFRYSPWLGTSRWFHNQAHTSTLATVDEHSIEERMYGVQGASILVTRSFLERVGLLSEEYFLYYEEQDWATRGREAGFRIAFSAQSIVYHKEGAATGGRSEDEREKSFVSDYYSIRARLLFTRRFYPYALPCVYLGLLGTIANRIRRRQYRRIWMVAKLAITTLVDRGGHG